MKNESEWEEAPRKGGKSEWEDGDATPGRRFDPSSTPGPSATPSSSSSRKSKNRWDETPTPGHALDTAETPRRAWDETPKRPVSGETPTPKRGRSRWDETPLVGGATPSISSGGATPAGLGMADATPTPSQFNRVMMTPEHLGAVRWEKEIDERNRPLTDDEIDAMLPTSGYKILDPPSNYVPIRTPARKYMATPTPLQTPTGYSIPEEIAGSSQMIPQTPSNLPHMKPDDLAYFEKLLVDTPEEELSPEEIKERKIMKLLLKVKNGTPPMRKSALRQLTDKAREFGPGPLFNQILPLLMSPTLEDQERHLLVKVIDRVLYKLDDLVRPYVHKILVVIEPLLIDEDYYARVEGREIISNLSKAAGLATMIATMRPDIDNLDEYVRNTTARAFSVVASALGIPALLPFLKAVCQSKKSWQARHTGIKIVQQIAILMGCAILPHLKSLVEIIEHGLQDEQQKVKTITGTSLFPLLFPCGLY